MTTPICFIDTETDGVHPGRNPWEIALIRRDDEHGEQEVSFFVEIDLSTADPFGLKVGRFWDRHPTGRYLSVPFANAHAPEPSATNRLHTRETAAHVVARMTHGAHLVGAVPNFDTEVFDRLLRDHGLCPGWHYHLIDIEALCVGFAAARGTTILPPWNSDKLMAELGVEPPSDEDRHTALGDARWAMRTYDTIVGHQP